MQTSLNLTPMSYPAVISNTGGLCICLLTEHSSADFITASRYLSGNPSGKRIFMDILVTIPVSSLFSISRNNFSPAEEISRRWQKFKTYIPTQVPMEARKRSKGAGKAPSPPLALDWSVFIVKPLYKASTCLPPGKVISII
ncbi:MAG TPA: hypothetical protein PLL10_05500 [Elusimicrobiales bacterium]|nr:hypothetical protein [Elusimicrobiales bacterium]